MNSLSMKRAPTVKDVEALKDAASAPAEDILPMAAAVVRELYPECYWNVLLSLPDTVLSDLTVCGERLVMTDEGSMSEVDCESLPAQFRRDLANRLWNEILDYINLDNTL